MATAKEMQKYLDSVRTFYSQVPLYDMKAKGRMVEDLLIDIFVWLRDHPKDQSDETDRLFRQYLPMIQDLMKNYTDLLSSDLNAKMTEEVRIHASDLLNSTIIALTRIKDSLFTSDVLDASVDMEVVKKLMHQDGLLGGKDFES